MDELAQAVGDNIKHYRRAAKLTQRELAGQVELDRKSLSRIEGGHQLPGLRLLEKLAQSLGIGLWQLVDKGREQARKMGDLAEVCDITGLAASERALIIDLARRCAEHFRGMK